MIQTYTADHIIGLNTRGADFNSYPVPLTIRIEQRHIDGGLPHDCRFCPLAQALMDMGKKDVFVGFGWIKFTDSIEWVAYFTPAVIEFVRQFDGGAEVDPTTLFIEVWPCSSASM